MSGHGGRGMTIAKQVREACAVIVESAMQHGLAAEIRAFDLSQFEPTEDMMPCACRFDQNNENRLECLMHKKQRERAEKAEQALSHALRAICLTRDYVGEDKLPARDGWEWYEAAKAIMVIIPDDEWTQQAKLRIDAAMKGGKGVSELTNNKLCELLLDIASALSMRDMGKLTMSNPDKPELDADVVVAEAAMRIAELEQVVQKVALLHDIGDPRYDDVIYMAQEMMGRGFAIDAAMEDKK